MGLSDKQWIFLQDISKLIQEAQRLNIKLTGGELYRTQYQQERYLATGKSKTMKSKHLSRLAMDFNFFVDDGKRLTYELEDVKELGKYWESLRDTNQAGMFWKFRDTPHFQG